VKEPKARMWIDARNEVLAPGDRKKVRYCIKKLADSEVKKRLYEAIGTYVYEIRVVSEKENEIDVVYDENFITVTFIDYRLRLKGLSFKKEGG